MDILKIILGVIATVAAFYVTSSMLLAQKQLIAATRLSGYLSYWQNWILERGYSKIYALGAVWNKEDLDVRKSGGGPAELIKLQEERRKQLEDIKQKLEEGGVFDGNELVRQVQRFPRDSIANILESSGIAKQNIVEGKTFISDEEATTLGVPFTHKCIELKMGIIDLIDSGAIFVAVLLASPEKFDIGSFSTEIAEVIWKAISVVRNIDLLAAPARVISSKSVLELTVQNVMTGKPLTKRLMLTMHCLLPVLLALRSAIVIAVLYNDEVMLAVQTQRDVIYTAEFSRNALGPDSFIDGDRVEAEVRGSTMKVKRKDGKIVSGRVMWEQRTLVHPIPKG